MSGIYTLAGREDRDVIGSLLFVLNMVSAMSGDAAASYDVRLVATDPPRFHVVAELPIAGDELLMTRTRPGNVAEILKHGWPALVANLVVSDPYGRTLESTRNGPAGWRLARPHHGRVRVAYDVDYGLLARNDWPAPREAAFADRNHIAVIGRSLFVTTPQSSASRVRFATPRGWRTATGWEPSRRGFIVGTTGDLVDNLIAITTHEVERVTAGKLEVLIVPIGRWRQARPEIRRVLHASIPQLAALMPLDRKERYLTVLLPLAEPGGESFRRSMAMTSDDAPSAANVKAWGNTIAHEIFHTWNGWSLKPAAYASSQWFQEGATEYAANLATVRSGVMSETDFRHKLAHHVRNYRELAHPIGAPATRKGPPLYSAGALVAFAWDVHIREQTDGERDFSSFLRNLWHVTEKGARPYEVADLRAALAQTAPYDWDAFFETHIEGHEPLDLQDLFARAGLRVGGDRGAEQIEEEPAAPSSARALWRALVTRR